MKSLERNTCASSDGTILSYESIGQGPGLIILHGALSDIQEYTQLAIALSSSYRVHLMRRRDREGMYAAYSVEYECQDVLALQQVTRAEFLFGHSFGGLVALEAAVLSNPFKRIIVYEPGVAINWKWDWLTAYQAAITRRRYRKAFTAFVRGMGHSPLSKAPRWLAALVLRIAINGKDWKLKKNLLVSNLREHLEVKRLEGSYKKYAVISVPVLLAAGEKSPDFVTDMLTVLAREIPHSQVLNLPGLGHLSPQNNGAPEIISNHIIDFLSRVQGKQQSSLP
jgi:pimeloyl-ACP methyl ester carboxylesterase